MSDDNPDRRVQRTRAAVSRAFNELLLDVGYEAMTVAQVAERANVGRSTLYEHFGTKDDLLKASLATPFKVIAGVFGEDSNEHALAALLDHFRTQASVARVLLSQPMRSRIARVLAAELSARMKARPVPAAVPADLLAIAVAEGQLALIDSWLRSYPSISSRTIAAQLAGFSRTVGLGLA